VAPIAVARRSRVPSRSIALPLVERRHSVTPAAKTRAIALVDVVGFAIFRLEPVDRLLHCAHLEAERQDDRPGPERREQQADHHGAHHPVRLQEQADRRHGGGVGADEFHDRFSSP